MAKFVLVTDFAWPSLETERTILAKVGAELVVAETGDEDELAALAPRADAILTNWKPVTARVLECAKRCLTVARYGVGVDNIDVDTATKLGILVSNVPDYCIDEVSDHALALMLALTRRLVDFAVQTRSGGWDNQEFGTPHRLRGQALGLVGFGRIARLVAKKAEAFGMSVSAYSPRLREGGPDHVRVARSLDDLLSTSDIVSLHAPLNGSTRHMIGATELVRMRPGAVLVNTARGALIDENALFEALGDGTLAGVGLDVMDQEPPPPNHPLRGAPGVLMTPHAAFYSAESVHELQEKAAANVVRVLSGVIPETTVNRDVLESPNLRGVLSR